MVVEGIALVTNLNNTGSDPPANSQRQILADDMRRRGVEKPNELLSLRSTSLVLIRAQLPPAARKGERVDIEVMVPTRSETESLRNGWLMQSRLQEMAVLGNQIRQGNVQACAEGAVVVNSLLEGDSDPLAETRGRVLGGAVIAQARPLGLVLKSEHHSVRTSAMIGQAINTRFHTFDRGNKRGVANPKRDSYIDLVVHSNYRHNLYRFLRVIQSIPLNENPRERVQRMSDLELQLQQSETALQAALDLEAIGTEAVPVLLRGLESADPLVRFAAAEALAYIGKKEGVPHLLEAARDESALRWNALTALATLVDTDARDALATLLHERSAETRYGAFKAILDSNPRDPVIRGEILEDTLALHEIASSGEPMVHVRRTERPEIVLFGTEIRLESPTVIFAGPQIMIKSEGADRMKVSRFTLGQGDTFQYCTSRLTDVIRTMVVLGASYTDVVSAITQARDRGSLKARVAFEALPRQGRQYYLDEAETTDPETDSEAWSPEDDPEPASEEPAGMPSEVTL